MKRITILIFAATVLAFIPSPFPIFAVEEIWSYIPQPFITYAEPDFQAETLGSYSPQAINILQTNGNGWVLIRTDYGAQWLNLDYAPQRNALEDFMKQYNNTVSMYYENLQSGFVYRYNADKFYYAASVIKAPYCLYIYDLAEKGQTDLTARHTYVGAYYNNGSGIIKTMKTGAAFSENELLSLTIRESDNIAAKMLIDKYGVDGFKGFVSEIGGNPDLIGKILFAFK